MIKKSKRNRPEQLFFFSETILLVYRSYTNRAQLLLEKKTRACFEISPKKLLSTLLVWNLGFHLCACVCVQIPGPENH